MKSTETTGHSDAPVSAVDEMVWLVWDCDELRSLHRSERGARSFRADIVAGQVADEPEYADLIEKSFTITRMRVRA